MGASSWRIYYDDGATFDGAAPDAPNLGVVVLVQRLEGSRPPVQVLHQSDFYWWRDEQWWAGDIFGFLDQAANFGASWVKQGRTVKTETYQAIIDAAQALRDEWDS